MAILPLSDTYPSFQLFENFPLQKSKMTRPLRPFWLLPQKWPQSWPKKGPKALLAVADFLSFYKSSYTKPLDPQPDPKMVIFSQTFVRFWAKMTLNFT